jgi:hypothetical protein
MYVLNGCLCKIIHHTVTLPHVHLVTDSSHGCNNDNKPVRDTDQGVLGMGSFGELNYMTRLHNMALCTLGTSYINYKG